MRCMRKGEGMELIRGTRVKRSFLGKGKGLRWTGRRAGARYQEVSAEKLVDWLDENLRALDELEGRYENEV